jgi:hypothetical protein
MQLSGLCGVLPNRKYFTVSQHADAPKHRLPLNTVNFSAGGNAKNTIPIPLICGEHISDSDLIENKKEFFCSFVGSINTHPCRAMLFNALGGKSDYKFVLKEKWSNEISESERFNFIEVTKRSKFTLCPRGYGATSWRLYEAMQLNSVPVYIYDKLHLPFQEQLNWDDICVSIHIDDIQSVDQILRSISDDRYEFMVDTIRNVYHRFFTLSYMSSYILEALKKLGDK